MQPAPARSILDRVFVAHVSFVVDGEKMFITNAGTPLSAVVTITARTGADEVSTLLVENGAPGYAVGWYWATENAGNGGPVCESSATVFTCSSTSTTST